MCSWFGAISSDGTWLSQASDGRLHIQGITKTCISDSEFVAAAPQLGEDGKGKDIMH